MSESLHVLIEKSSCFLSSHLQSSGKQMITASGVLYSFLMKLDALNLQPITLFSIIRYYKPKTNKKIDFCVYLQVKAVKEIVPTTSMIVSYVHRFRSLINTNGTRLQTFFIRKLMLVIVGGIADVEKTFMCCHI
ncbi:hypothetical protein P9D77_03615 [Bacillus rugosus]|uniref:hypothetical protein n=1 Tax=Bacillus rugosus TaxID=2715209 RepID=UPI002DB7AEA4|nr:hypothetical protein [Bacillus rugosus]MEC1547453.1 hypothetical protein [Bacillus rugosus]